MIVCNCGYSGVVQRVISYVAQQHLPPPCAIHKTARPAFESAQYALWLRVRVPCRGECESIAVFLCNSNVLIQPTSCQYLVQSVNRDSPRHNDKEARTLAAQVSSSSFLSHIWQLVYPYPIGESKNARPISISAWKCCLVKSISCILLSLEALRLKTCPVSFRFKWVKIRLGNWMYFFIFFRSRQCLKPVCKVIF